MSSKKSIFSVQREISKLLNSLSQSQFRRVLKNPKVSKNYNNINNLGIYRSHFAGVKLLVSSPRMSSAP